MSASHTPVYFSCILHSFFVFYASKFKIILLACMSVRQNDDDLEIKSKIYSLNCLSCFYSYLELQDDCMEF